MNPLNAQQIADILGASIVAGDAAALCDGGVSIDTRTLSSGSLYVGIRGENFDGDQFARAALDAGAKVLVVHHWDGGDVKNAAVLQVSDTLLALQKLAHWWRKQLDIEVVGVTGSNGKTSTKDFIASVLSQQFQVSATKGNLNNHIGVPLTVLRTKPQDQVAVWEMGMNHAGEIAPLCEIVRPRLGVITNIGTAHIEFLGSRDAIAEEKGMLARALPTDGILFIPATCDYYEYLRNRTKASIVSVGNGRGLVRAEELEFQADHTAFNLVIEGAGSARVKIAIPGRHMVTNALLAAGVGWKMGLTIEQIATGLSMAYLTGGRLNRYQYKGIEVIDDTYNANPESMAAAIDTLADLPAVEGAKKIIVLGRMGELGVHADAAHLQVGRLAIERGLSVVAVGEGADLIAQGASESPYFPVLADAVPWLSSHAKSGDVVLFKGSRTATVEKVMNSVFPRI